MDESPGLTNTDLPGDEECAGGAPRVPSQHMYLRPISSDIARGAIRTITAILTIAGAACSSDARKEPAPTASSASAGRAELVPSSAPEAPIEVRSPYRMRRVETFEKPYIHNAGTVLIACTDGCRSVLAGARTNPRIRIVERARVLEADWLLPATKELQSATYTTRFYGTYPGAFYAIAGDYEDRAGFANELQWSGKAWAAARVPGAVQVPPTRPPPPVKPNRDALLRAPWPRADAEIVHGGAGPLVMIRKKGGYATWRDGKWTQAEAPWGTISLGAPTRLASGKTVVGGAKGAFVIDADGAAAPVTVLTPVGGVDPAPLTDAEIEVVDGTVWLVAGPFNGDRAVLIPEDAATFAVAKPAETSVPIASAPIASANPAASVAPATSAAPVATGTPDATAAPVATAIPAASAAPAVSADAPISPLPEMGPRSETCKTPFVILGPASTAAAEKSPDRAPYHRIRQALVGLGALQDEVLFVEYARGEKRFFGVQLRTDAATQNLTRQLTDKLAGWQPAVGCLDVTSVVTDVDAPPPGVSVIFINLTTGEAVR